MPQNTVKLWNVFITVNFETTFYFSSESESESMYALKFAQENNFDACMICEDIDVDDVEEFLNYKTNEKNELGLKYHNHKQGEENDGTTNYATK